MSKKRKLIETFPLASAEQKLARLRQQVAEMETVVQELKEKEEEEERKNANTDGTLLLTPEAFQRALGWLSPVDLYTCLRVSKHWQREIDKPRIWRQAAFNQAPKLFKDIEQGKGANGSLNYKGMAMKLVCFHSRDATDVVPVPLMDPSLCPSDVFVLFDVKDRNSGKVIGSWHQRIDPDQLFDDRGFNHFEVFDNLRDLMITPKASELDGCFDDHFPFEEQEPCTFVPHAIWDQILFTVRLLRCDNGKMFSFGRDKVVTIFPDSGVTAGALFRIGPPAGNNGAGVRARTLWDVYEYKSMKLIVTPYLRPVFPAGWIELGLDSRRIWRHACYNLLQMDCWLGISQQSLEEQVVEAPMNPVRRIDDLMITLEGLNWT